jgi:hypothetical protein
VDSEDTQGFTEASTDRSPNTHTRAERKHGAGGGEPLRMLDTFGSVGVRTFDVTFTDIDARKRGYRPAHPLHDICRSMRSSLIESCTRNGINIIIRPHRPVRASLVQLDDLNAAALRRLNDVAFMVLATSPRNHQVWVALEGATVDFARRLRKGAGADANASGATRAAGTLNFRRKYAPNFPQVCIVDAVPNRVVNAADLERMGLLAAVDPVQRFRGAGGGVRRKWPSYEQCVAKAPLAHNSDEPDISRADFTWCLIAADWGHEADEIAAHLMHLSSKARKNNESYAARTAERAVEVVNRRKC